MKNYMMCGNRKIFFGADNQEQRKSHDCVLQKELHQVATKCHREHDAIKDIEIHLDTLIFSNKKNQAEAVALANQARFARQIIEDLQMKVNQFANTLNDDNECKDDLTMRVNLTGHKL